MHSTVELNIRGVKYIWGKFCPMENFAFRPVMFWLATPEKV